LVNKKPPSPHGLGGSPVSSPRIHGTADYPPRVGAGINNGNHGRLELIKKSVGLLASESLYSPRLPNPFGSVTWCGFRPRLQRPDRNGFAPFSLLGHVATAPIFPMQTTLQQQVTLLFGPPRHLKKKAKKIPGSNRIWSGDALVLSTYRCFPWSKGKNALYFSGRSSDFRINLRVAPSQPFGQWHHATFVPEYSGGPVPDSHGVPFSSFRIL